MSLSSYSERLCECLRLESRALWGRPKATLEQVKQLPGLPTCPRHTPGLWGSEEGTQCRLPCHAAAFTPWQRFLEGCPVFPRGAKRLAFSAAHTPPCWWQRAGRSQQPAPSPTPSAFCRLHTLGVKVHNDIYSDALEVCGIKYPSPMCFDRA